MRGQWRWLRLACCGIVVLWFAWFAYVHITTPPAAFAQRAQTDDREADQLSRDLAEALRGLTPPAAPLTTSAPAAPTWFWWAPGQLVEALVEAWDPTNNASQQAAVSYITGSVAGALDRIVELVDEHPKFDRPVELAALGTGGFWLPYDQRDLAVAALAFRARYRAAAAGDLAGARHDLRSALLLAQQQDSSYLDLARICHHELGCMLQERDIPPREAARMIAFLRDELSLSVTATAAQTLGAGGQIERLLDQYYTRDSGGDGWVVLSAAARALPGRSGSGRERSRLWNIFSPLFHGRAAMRRKITRLSEELGRLDERPCVEAIAQLTRRNSQHLKPSVLDGPLADITASVDEATLRRTFFRVMQNRVATVMLALSAFKHEHGHYPAALSELVPTYLDEVPLDAFSYEPFVYERCGESAYELRSTRQLPDDLQTTWPVCLPAFEANSYLPRRTPTGTKGD